MAVTHRGGGDGSLCLASGSLSLAVTPRKVGVVSSHRVPGSGNSRASLFPGRWKQQLTPSCRALCSDVDPLGGGGEMQWWAAPTSGV